MCASGSVPFCNIAREGKHLGKNIILPPQHPTFHPYIFIMWPNGAGSLLSDFPGKFLWTHNGILKNLRRSAIRLSVAVTEISSTVVLTNVFVYWPVDRDQTGSCISDFDAQTWHCHPFVRNRVSHINFYFSNDWVCLSVITSMLNILQCHPVLPSPSHLMGKLLLIFPFGGWEKWRLGRIGRNSGTNITLRQCLDLGILCLWEIQGESSMGQRFLSSYSIRRDGIIK